MIVAWRNKVLGRIILAPFDTDSGFVRKAMREAEPIAAFSRWDLHEIQRRLQGFTLIGRGPDSATYPSSESLVRLLRELQNDESREADENLVNQR